ncbi:MAG TPA: hypothetical protein VGA37_12440 [Gemmatimonadales bacterium]
MRPIRLVPLALVLGVAPASAQGGSDIYLATVAPSPLGPKLESPNNVTLRTGYDNQPFFVPDGSAILFTSIRDGQADIYRYTIASGRTTQLTDTPESEYSPTIMPGHTRFSVIRVEPDSAQRLWAFALDGGNPRLLLPGVAPVGYQGWADPATVVLFVLGTPATLQVANLTTGTARIVATDVGRSIAMAPGNGSIGFVQQRDGEPWLALLDVVTGRTDPVVKLPEAGFFAWMPDGSVVAGRGTQILLFQPDRGGDWSVLADFSDGGIMGITRIAVSAAGDRIAFVAADAALGG